MTKLIANLIRSFHAIFWFILFCGILFSTTPQVNMICTFLIVIAIVLWGIVGHCFMNILENGFDPIRLREDEPQEDENMGAAFDWMSRITHIHPIYYSLAFNYFIYLVLFIGVFRIFCFMNQTNLKVDI